MLRAAAAGTPTLSHGTAATRTVSGLASSLLHFGGIGAYALVGALCFGEAALFLGFVLPGETAVVLGGVLASEGRISLVPLLVLVVACAIGGDTVGYEVGRHFGPALLEHRPLRGNPAVARTTRLVKRRGAVAVFLGRFTAVFRALVPGVAGVSGVPYPRFALANAAGGLIWGVGYALAGYYVGQQVLSTGSVISGVIIGCVAALLVGLEVRKHLRRRRASREVSSPPPS